MSKILIIKNIKHKEIDAGELWSAILAKSVLAADEEDLRGLISGKYKRFAVIPTK
ncbi:hypothetical protein [Paenibacillus silvestris]|uniref:hypothetical protein n=1 Tax=Paenibacillus silvestris TaxID=2606219 RepID=UPI0013725F39|nr:hypothetical protein [Paenibacillus silvestris]